MAAATMPIHASDEPLSALVSQHATQPVLERHAHLNRVARVRGRPAEVAPSGCVVGRTEVMCGVAGNEAGNQNSIKYC